MEDKRFNNNLVQTFYGQDDILKITLEQLYKLTG